MYGLPTGKGHERVENDQRVAVNGRRCVVTANADCPNGQHVEKGTI